MRKKKEEEELLFKVERQQAARIYTVYKKIAVALRGLPNPNNSLQKTWAPSAPKKPTIYSTNFPRKQPTGNNYSHPEFPQIAENTGRRNKNFFFGEKTQVLL